MNEWTGPVTPKAAAEWDDYPPSTTFASGELLDVIDPDPDEARLNTRTTYLR